MSEQLDEYKVLPYEERFNYQRPIRYSYIHTTCGSVTTMRGDIAETYAVNPTFYTHTFCVACNNHFPVSEFTWDSDGSVVGS